MSFLEPNVHLFSFNNPYGACPKCEGYGDILGIDPDLVVPHSGLSFMRKRSPHGEEVVQKIS